MPQLCAVTIFCRTWEQAYRLGGRIATGYGLYAGVKCVCMDAYYYTAEDRARIMEAITPAHRRWIRQYNIAWARGVYGNGPQATADSWKLANAVNASWR